jgi:chromosome partitioning protein
MSDSRGRVLSVVSQKGGVGKTTTVVNLGAAFARRGLRTLIVDADPQGSVRFGVGLKKGHPTVGFADYLSGRAPLRDVILPTQLQWLRVMLAGTVVEEVDHLAYLARFEQSTLLDEVLEMATSRCDIVLVDTPPGLGPIVRRVLQKTQRVLVPLQCEPLALQTTPQILRGIQDIVSTNEGLTLDGILLTMYDAGNPVSERVVEYVRKNLPPSVLIDVMIPKTSPAADAFAAGQPVVLRDPADAAAQAYVNLATLLAERYQ